MKKQIIKIIILIIFILPIIANAATVQTGKFKYMPAFAEAQEETYYYSDDYFKQSGKKDNEHLLTMSLNLALSTFEIRNATYSTNLLKEIGFKNIKVEDMLEKPTLNTIGTVIAHKKVDNYNLVSIAIRGEKYDSEWGNNFIVGKSGNAKGFDDSSKIVINRIKEYIQDNNLKNVKIWLSGYSRAGTVANLTGVYINNNLGEFNTKADDLYIYTFEPPAASIDDTIYENIYTIKNINDMIPEVYPTEWGFHTNGKLIKIGENTTITTYKGLEEQTEYQEENLNDFYKKFFKWLTGRLSRKTYAENLEEPVSKILDIYFSKSEEEREKLKNFILEDLKAQLLDNEDNFNPIKSKVWSVLGHNSDYLYHSIVDDIIEIMNSIRNTPNGSVLTDEEYNTIIDSLYPVLRVLGPIIVDDTNYYDGINYDEYYREKVEDYLLTDEEMGTKYGKLDAKDYGYEDGFTGNPKNENGYDIFDDYGPIYEEAYINAYAPSYIEAYELGKSHKEDLAAKGKYDGAKYAYENGYYDGSHNEESVLYDEYFYEEDWMTPEYIEAYNNEYEKKYLEGYEEGLNNPATGEEEFVEQIALYHLASLFKNIQTIIKQHYPQNNLSLVKNNDSYYKAYEFIEGENQTIDLEKDENGNLNFKANGDIEKLVKVQVDEKDLSPDNYELKSGSTIVILKESYLQTLKDGQHTLKLTYIDDTISTNFTTVNSNPEEITTTSETNNSTTERKNTAINPKTGDNIKLYISILIASAILLILIIAFAKKNKKCK